MDDYDDYGSYGDEDDGFDAALGNATNDFGFDVDEFANEPQ